MGLALKPEPLRSRREFLIASGPHIAGCRLTALAISDVHEDILQESALASQKLMQPMPLRVASRKTQLDSATTLLAVVVDEAPALEASERRSICIGQWNMDIIRLKSITAVGSHAGCTMKVVSGFDPLRILLENLSQQRGR